MDDSAATGPVTTKCQKQHEAANYTDFEPTFQATEQIEKICLDIPIHFIFAEKNDLVCAARFILILHDLILPMNASPRYSQDSIVDPLKGRHAASITRVSGAGHMVSCTSITTGGRGDTGNLICTYRSSSRNQML